MAQYSSVFGDADWVAYYKKRKPDLTEIKDGINDIKQSIANLECGGSGGSSGGGSGGGNTYAHKVEIKFNNFSLSYYGQEHNHVICSFDFDSIANNSIGRNDISVSGDLQEILNFYPIMLSPYSKEFKTACHVYLKDADTENLVEGIGISGSSSEGSRKVGILFNKGTQDKFFNNTIVLEWGLEVSSGGGSGGSSQTTIQELSVTENGTYNAGDNAAYNPVTVNVPSGGGGEVIIETSNLGANSDPITISYEGKSFVFLGNLNSSGKLIGIGGNEDNLLAPIESVNISSVGTIAGTVSCDHNTKTITYTPNISFRYGTVAITKVIV